MIQVEYPKTLDAFLPLIDGFHPIDGEDINERMRVIERVQQVLGWGTSSTYGGTAIGPRGKNASVRERLDTFLDPAGAGIRDCFVVTGSAVVGTLSEGAGGLIVPFGRTLPSTDYRTFFQGFSTITKLEANDEEMRDELLAPGWFWLSAKTQTSVHIEGRPMSSRVKFARGNAGADFRWACWIIGDAATIT